MIKEVGGTIVLLILLINKFYRSNVNNWQLSSIPLGRAMTQPVGV